jgi:DNA polymerase I-like protein with 3'-5' exonuclease and polymerase domains
LAAAKFDRIKRAGTYKAINSIVQGSAAEQTKKAIVALASQGIYPLMQVYDELSGSIGDEKTASIYKEAMEHAIEFEVPSLVDQKIGPSWGQCE